MADCPEPELADDVCDLCLFEVEVSDRLETIESLINAALESKPLLNHPHRIANSHLRAALAELDELESVLVRDGH